jgi:hypothetical protein
MDAKMLLVYYVKTRFPSLGITLKNKNNASYFHSLFVLDFFTAQQAVGAGFLLPVYASLARGRLV